MSLASMNLRNLLDTQGNPIHYESQYFLSYKELSNIKYDEPGITPPNNCELPDIFKETGSLLRSPNGNGGSAKLKYHQKILKGSELLDLLPTLNYNTVRDTSIKKCEPLSCIIL